MPKIFDLNFDTLDLEGTGKGWIPFIEDSDSWKGSLFLLVTSSVGEQK